MGITVSIMVETEHVDTTQIVFSKFGTYIVQTILFKLIESCTSKQGAVIVDFSVTAAYKPRI